jgi:hypothetical protein
MIEGARIVVARGFWRWLLIRQDAMAITMPWCSIYILEEAIGDYGLIVHEAAHITQIARDGAFLFTIKYIWFHFRYGYWENPYEREAYNTEAKIMSEVVGRTGSEVL